MQCTAEVTDGHGKCIQLIVSNTMLSITNALNNTSTQIFLSTKHNQFGTILINSHTIEYKAVAIRSYIHSVCIKFVNTLPWAVPSVDVYKSDIYRPYGCDNHYLHTHKLAQSPVSEPVHIRTRLFMIAVCFIFNGAV